MQYPVDRLTLRITTRCNKDFICQSDKQKELCKIEVRKFNSITSILCLEKKPCNYQLSVGFSNVCGCPTRSELFKKYNV